MPTLEEALETAAQLPVQQQEMLAEILRQRQNAAWRSQTAEDARRSIALFQQGKLRPESSADVIAQLRKSLESTSEE